MIHQRPDFDETSNDVSDQPKMDSMFSRYKLANSEMEPAQINRPAL